MRSEIFGEFKEFMVAICIDESIGNYEMRFGFFNPDMGWYISKTYDEFKEKDIRLIRSKSLYLFIDGLNNYIIDRKLDFSNLIVSREDREGAELEEEVYELFNAYNKIKDSLRIFAPELNKFDDYLNNFGMEDLINGKTDILVYNQFEEFALAIIEKKNDIAQSKSPHERMMEIFDTPSTKEEVTDLMLDDILKLKNSVKERNDKDTRLYSMNIRNYSKILDYNPNELLKGIIKKK